ncbi:MAG: hypothetical protein OXN26_03290 [Gammaproteobacteria bacterium]|nr:hypothetical protein [Gammaproteobacteria bacterium]
MGCEGCNPLATIVAVVEVPGRGAVGVVPHPGLARDIAAGIVAQGLQPLVPGAPPGDGRHPPGLRIIGAAHAHRPAPQGLPRRVAAGVPEGHGAVGPPRRAVLVHRIHPPVHMAPGVVLHLHGVVAPVLAAAGRIEELVRAPVGIPGLPAVPGGLTAGRGADAHRGVGQGRPAQGVVAVPAGIAGMGVRDLAPSRPLVPR